jgi:hypothetical protein
VAVNIYFYLINVFLFFIFLSWLRCNKVEHKNKEKRWRAYIDQEAIIFFHQAQSMYMTKNGGYEKMTTTSKQHCVTSFSPGV